MCVKFQLSVSESSRDIKGIVLPAGSVHLQAREFDPDSASQRQFPLLPPTAAIRYCLVVPRITGVTLDPLNGTLASARGRRLLCTAFGTYIGVAHLT